MKHTRGPCSVGWSSPKKPCIICIVPHEDDPDSDRFVLTASKRESPEDDAKFIAWCYNNATLLEAAHDLLAAIKGIKALLSPDGEYAICKGDGTMMWLGDDMIVGGVFEKADAAIARAREE